MKRRESVPAHLHVLGDLLSGASLRATAAIKHVGEIAAVFIGDGNDAGIDVDSDKKDVWVGFTDLLSGLAGVGRLFIPAGILFRLPHAGDGGHVASGRKMRGPGASLVIPDGGDGKTAVVPGWDDGADLDDNNSGVMLPEGFHVESKGDRVRIVANSGGTKSVVELQKGGKITITAFAGQNLELNGNTYTAVLGELLLAAFNAHTHGTPVGPSSPPVTPLTTSVLSQLGVKLA